MLGPLDAPVAHLALDDPWVLALAAWRERLGEDLSDRALVGRFDALGEKDPVLCGLSAGRRGGF
jgi:hypothetical protein